MVCSEFFPIMFFLVDREVCKCFSGFRVFFLAPFLHLESTFRLGSRCESLDQSAKQTYLPQASAGQCPSELLQWLENLHLSVLPIKTRETVYAAFRLSFVKQPDSSLQGSCLYWIASGNGATRQQFIGMQRLLLQHLPPFQTLFLLCSFMFMVLSLFLFSTRDTNSARFELIFGELNTRWAIGSDSLVK